ncbi:AAA family ATPase [Solirubrobacter taibaiensis]|nr:AAA family ATPase [Solirubrobacter taibaiensis]
MERDAEIAAIEQLVENGGVLVLEGPAGIGKTFLLAETIRRATSAGRLVLRARASELERDHGFGVVRQLLEPAVVRADADRRDALLEGAASLAAPAVGLAAGGAGDRFAVLHGLYWLVANLTALEDRPLLLVVDDLQWADAPSLGFLAYLVRRLEGLPVAVAAAARPALPGETREEIEAIVAEAGGTALTPGPLSPQAVATLAAAKLSEAPAPEFVTAVIEATGGNALLVDDLLTETMAAGVAPDAVAATQLEALGTERIARRVARLLGALPPGARSLADAVVVLGDGCDLPVAAMLAVVTLDDARTAASALTAADVLDDTTTLQFRHPLVRAAVADRIPAVERAAAHGAAARLLQRRGVTSPSVLATHLMAAPTAGDPWVVDTLVAAAREARAEGAPEIAAAQLERALREPPTAGARSDVLRALGDARHALGHPEAAATLREAWDATSDPVVRARDALGLVTGLAERHRWPEAAEIARVALTEVGADVEPTDHDLRETWLLLHAHLADSVRMDATIGGDEPARLAALAARLSGATDGERWVLAMAAMMSSTNTAEGHAHAADLVERAACGGDLPDNFPATGVISSLIRASRLDAAEDATNRLVRQTQARGLAVRYALSLQFRGWIELERGRLADAELSFRDSYDLAPDGNVASFLALAVAEGGRLDEAGEIITATGIGGVLPERQVNNVVLAQRARVRLLQGDAQGALDDALEVGRRYDRLGIRRAVPPWRSLAASVLAAQGETERARSLVEEEIELAERWGTPLARGLALRGRGLVTGDVDDLAVAVELLAASPARLHEAYARVDLGAALRRANRRAVARGPLTAGMDLAHACGAKLLAERARTELLATGARPRRLAVSGTDALTPSEKRVVELAAQGLTNRRIAQDLFVTMATVETHLRHAFRKLDVKSRTELADLSG